MQYPSTPTSDFSIPQRVQTADAHPLPPAPSPLQGEGERKKTARNEIRNINRVVVHSFCSFLFCKKFCADLYWKCRLGFNVNGDVKQGGEACPSRPTRTSRSDSLQVFTADDTRLRPGEERPSRGKYRGAQCRVQKRMATFFFGPYTGGLVQESRKKYIYISIL